MPALRLFDPTADSARVHPPQHAPPVLGRDVISQYLQDLEYRQKTGLVSAAHEANFRRSLLTAPRGNGVARFVGFEEIVGDRPFAELVQNDVTHWIRSNPGWRSAETRRRNLSAVLACFTWAEEEFNLRSPYRKTNRLREPRVERRDASDAETAAFWAAAYEELRRIIWFVDQTGARTCEAREMRWSQINWEEGFAEFEHNKINRQMKTRRPRIVGLSEAVLEAMRPWVVPGPTHVFLTRKGVPWTKNHLCNQFAAVRNACGLSKALTPYCFRHRFGTAVILAGGSERDAADSLGHAGTSSVRRYTHTLEKRDHIAAKAEEISARRALPKKRRRRNVDFPLFEGQE